MTTKGKKILAFILASVMLMTSITAFAAGSGRTRMVLAKKSAVSGVTIDRTTGKQVDLGAREDLGYIAAFVPENVKATASGNNIRISADTTTAAYRVQIRYSTDKNFKRNVKTANVGNAKYRNALPAMEISVNTATNKCKVTSGLMVQKNGWSEFVRKSVLRNGIRKDTGIAYINNASVIAGLRKGFGAVNTYRIGVKNPRTYYVQIRSAYKLDGKTYWSEWTTAKVR